MTTDLHTHRPRTIRSTAEIAAMSASEPMTAAERAIWFTAKFGELEQRLTGMTADELHTWSRYFTDQAAEVDAQPHG